MNESTLQPTRTIGAWGLRRRTKGNQEVASASKELLEMKLISGGHIISLTRQDKRRRAMPVSHHIAEQEHISLARKTVIVRPKSG